MIARTTSEGRRAWLLRTDRAAMLLSLSSGGALLLDHWGADGESDRGDDFLPRPPRNRPSHRSFFDASNYTGQTDASKRRTIPTNATFQTSERSKGTPAA